MNFAITAISSGTISRATMLRSRSKRLKDLGTVTLDKLDLYIKPCDAVVHLVGDMTGAAAKPESTAAILKKYPDLPDKLRRDCPGARRLNAERRMKKRLRPIERRSSAISMVGTTNQLADTAASQETSGDRDRGRR
jgi:hypothetical protein